MIGVFSKGLAVNGMNGRGDGLFNRRECPERVGECPCRYRRIASSNQDILTRFKFDGTHFPKTVFGGIDGAQCNLKIESKSFSVRFEINPGNEPFGWYIVWDGQLTAQGECEGPKESGCYKAVRARTKVVPARRFKVCSMLQRYGAGLRIDGSGEWGVFFLCSSLSPTTIIP